MLPMRCSQPPCRNMLVKIVAQGGTQLQPRRQLGIAEQHRRHHAEAETQRRRRARRQARACHRNTVEQAPTRP